MSLRFRRAVALALLVLAGASSGRPAHAQWGGFGANKIAYDNFRWKVYPSPHFDVYYYGEEEIFLDEVISSSPAARGAGSSRRPCCRSRACSGIRGCANSAIGRSASR